MGACVTERPFQNMPDLLAKVRARPGIYLGGKSLRNLFNFLGGFEMAEDAYQIPADRRLAGFDSQAFEEWADRRFNISTRSNMKSYGQAISEAGSDEAAFDLWFKWYDEFLADRSEAAPAAG
jgi:hypothetical protein